jgi:hypothetical protein
MSARLLAIAFNLLSPTLVACACHTPPLLERLWLLCRLVADVIAGGVLVGGSWAVFVILTRLIQVCRKLFSCGNNRRRHVDGW